jgi:hypothetical protein
MIGKSSKMTQDNLKLIFDLKNENIALKKQSNFVVMENRSFKNKYEALEKKYDALEKSIDDKINQAVINVITKLTDEFNVIIADKDQKIEKLTKEVERLKAQINKDSSNSSKPSSTNGFKNVIQNNREKSGKRPGGQLFHQGHKLELPSNLEQLIEEGKIKHEVIDIWEDGDVDSDDYDSKFVLDLEINTKLIEYRIHKGSNPDSNQTNNRELLNNLKSDVSYGVNIKALSTTLSNEGLIPIKRLSDFFSSITSGIIAPSTATIISFNKLLSKRLEETGQIEVIKNNLLNGESIYVDDTVLKSTEIPESDKREREDRKVFKCCLRNYSNELNTLFTFNSRKDEAGIIADDILLRYFGILNHDHESKYYIYGKWHSTCHPHVFREFKSVFENLKIEFATEIIRFFNKLNERKKILVENGIHQMTENELKSIDKEYDELIQKGWEQLKPLKKEYHYNETSNLLIRMEDYKENYLLFVTDFKADFSNNLSERDLRMAKLIAKISGPFRSFEGGKVFAINRSFISTIKKRKMNIFESLKSILEGNPVLT